MKAFLVLLFVVVVWVAVKLAKLRRDHTNVVEPKSTFISTRTVYPSLEGNLNSLNNSVNTKKEMADFTIQVTVNVTDPSGGKITIPLPVIDTGEAITGVLSQVENIAKPLLGIIQAL